MGSLAAALEPSVSPASPLVDKAGSRPSRRTRAGAGLELGNSPQRCSVFDQIPGGKTEDGIKPRLRGEGKSLYLPHVTFRTSIKVACAPDSIGAMVPIGGTVGTEEEGGTGCVAP